MTLHSLSEWLVGISADDFVGEHTVTFPFSRLGNDTAYMHRQVPVAELSPPWVDGKETAGQCRLSVVLNETTPCLHRDRLGLHVL